MNKRLCKSTLGWAVWVLAGMLITGCSTSQKSPDLGGLYNRLAQHESHERNPVILIPGLLGSKLRDSETGALIWGTFGRYHVGPNSEQGARLIALPMQEGMPLRQLKDNLEPDGALDRVVIDVAGYPVQLNTYANILSILGIGGFRDQQLAEAGWVDYGDRHFTCFQFDYDWRRDIVENARRLDSFILEKRAYVQQEIERRFGVKNHAVRFDIVTHSMGGLLARYYARYGAADMPVDGGRPKMTWEGAIHLSSIVMVGTPNAGSIEALQSLVNGYQPAPLLPGYEPAIIGTMPSLYQLLPRSRHRPLLDVNGDPVDDLFSPELWRKNRWGLADPEQKAVLETLLPEVDDPEIRSRIAIDHLTKSLIRARQFAAAMDAPAEPPSWLRLLLVAGDSMPTPKTLQVSPDGGVNVVAKGPGDGVVLRSSTLMDERSPFDVPQRLVSPIHWHQVLFLFDDHMKITQNPAFMDNLLFFLLESPLPATRTGALTLQNQAT